MKPIFIVDNCQHSLSRINESAGVANNPKIYNMSGVFTEFNIVNRNQRIYTAEKFLPALKEFQTRIQENGGCLYGEYDHPDVFDLSLQRVSHVIRNVQHDTNKNAILGQITLTNTYWGKEAKSLVDDNFPLYVSSRAAGITESDGHVTLKKLFTYDLVADPGFSSAKMNLNSINESLGYSSDSNFRIYELNSEAKINELVNMNDNDFITKMQMKEYSDYLTSEINKTKDLINKFVGENHSSDDIKKLLEYKDNLHTQQGKIMEYLQYMSERVLILVNENKALKERVDKLVGFVEHVAEHTQNNIKYSEYILEQLSKSVDFTEYVAEHTKNGIEFIEYVAEHTKGVISHNDHLAEHIMDNIAYLKYISERVDGSYEYAGHIAEKLNELGSSKSLNEAVISVETPVEFLGLQNDEKEGEEGEAQPETTSDMSAQGGESQPAQGETQPIDTQSNTVQDNPAPAQGEGDAQPAQDAQEPAQGEEAQPAQDAQGEDSLPDNIEGENEEGEEAQGEETSSQYEPNTIVQIAPNTTGFIVSIGADGIKVKTSGSDDLVTVQSEDISPLDMEEEGGSLSEMMKTLIEEARKREASKNTEPNFFKFLNESQIKDFKALPDSDREKVIVALNENDYFSGHDVMRIIQKTLSVPEQSVTEKVISKIPSDLLSAWEALDESAKNTIVTQSKFYQLNSDETIENFWRTRKLERILPIKEGKVEVPQNFDNDKISDEETERFLNMFDRLG